MTEFEQSALRRTQTEPLPSLRASTVRHRRQVALVAWLFGLAILGACGGGQDQTRAQPLPADDPGVSHVHGLGVDPADGKLFAATHYGLFSLPEDGVATRIAGRFQDTMGFVVAGPNRFLGSGHPDLQDDHLHRQGKPPHLGLIESLDAGSTWKPLSLLGDADFHAIALSGDTIAAYDSTGDRLMTSQDGRTWETKASGIGMSAVALDPANPQRLVGVTPGGLEGSVDGGVSFAPLESSPRGVLVNWRAGELWTVDAEGRVWRASGPEGPWSEQGVLPGSPEAFLATPNVLYAAARSDERTAIYQSTDQGRIWSLRYQDPTR